MFIDYTYFIRDIVIGQKSQPEVQEDIKNMLQVYEPEVLKSLFGLTMYKEFVDGLALDPIPDKWKNLRDGVIYDDGKKEWMGFVNDQKQSIIANYVYYYYTRKEVIQGVGTGNAIPKNENSTIVNPLSKQVRAWNEMVDWICQLDDFLKAHPVDYPNYKWKGHKSPCAKGCYCEPSCCCGKEEYPFSKINSLNL